MMRPCFLAFMRGANSRQTRNALVRLAARTRAHSSSPTSSSRSDCFGSAGSVSLRLGATGPPATFTRKSGVPALDDRRSTSSASVRSATMTSPLLWMSVAMTWTPSFARRSTTEAPMPLAAPVTSAFLPESPLSDIRGAVDVDRHAGHVGRVVGAERDDQRGGLGDGADTSHGNLLERTLRAFARAGHGRNPGEPATRDHAGRDAIDAHTELAELERELPRERHHSCLRHRIRTARAFSAGRNALARGNRSEVHDRPALLLQVRCDRAAAIEGRVEIGAEDGAPVVQRAIGEAAEAARRRRGQV